MTSHAPAARALRVCAVALLVLAAPVLAAGAARAHAFLVSSDPADGSVLASAPHELHLRLSEAVVLPATHVVLVGHDGTPVALGAPRAEDAPAQLTDPAPEPATAPSLVPAPVVEEEPPVSLVVPVLGTLPVGSYRLTVDTLSADDMHRTTAVVVFGVGQQVAPAGRTEAPAALDQAFLRWLALLGVAGGLGHALVVRLAAGSPGATAVLARSRRPVLTVVVLATLACVALPLVQALGSDVPLGTVLTGWYALRVGLRAVGLAAVALGLARAGWRVSRPLVLVGAVAAGTGTALLGHAAVSPVGPVRLAADVLHVLATTTWLGGVAMAVVLASGARRGQVSRAAVRAVIRSFARPATVAVAVMATTGVFLASSAVASVDAVLLTTYGRTLLLKVALVAVAALLGLRHVRWARAETAVRPPRSVAAESGLLVAALAMSALLSSGQPATAPDLSSAGDVTPSVAVDATAADLAEHTVVQPNRPGVNIAVVDVLDSRRPAPPRPVAVRVERVDARGVVTVSDGQRLPGEGWSVPLTVETPGPTPLRVVVVRPGLPDAVSSVTWVVGGAAPRPATVVSRTPVGGLLQGLSAALLGLALVALAVGVRRRRAAARAGAWADEVEPAPERERVVV